VEATGSWFARDVATAGGAWHTGLATLHPLWKVTGAWPAEDTDEAALGSELAHALGVVPGDTLTFTSAHGARLVRVTGVVAAGGLESSRAWLPLLLAQSLSGRAGEVDRVSLSALVRPAPKRAVPDPKRDAAAFERWMCTAYPENVARDLAACVPGAEVLPMTEVVSGEAGVVHRLNLLMLLLALAALTASTLGLLSTTTATVMERAREFGLMRALGATSSQLATLLLVETLLVSLAGGALGWLAGTGAAVLIRGEAFATPAAAQPLLLPAALAVAVLVALAGTLAPLRIALRMDPVEVLRG
jgi:putative ABC transport system permease protein